MPTLCRLFAPLLLALTALAVTAAPAPKPKPPPAPEVVAGYYTLSWSGGTYEVWLDSDGRYLCRVMGSGHWTWEGGWAWCKQTRALRVHESIDNPAFPPAPAVFSWWTVVLDRDLKGKASHGSTNEGVRVRLKMETMFQ